MGTLLIIIIIGVIIYTLINFNRGKSKEYSVVKREQQNQELVEEDYDIEKYISGYEYRADHWNPYTSLEALNHHREKLRKIKKSELPDYRDRHRSHGIWLPIVANCNQDKPSKEELQNIKFLRKFRKTFESSLTYDEKYKIISGLIEEYKELPLAQKSKEWFLWNLYEIHGINENIAKELYFNGYKSIQDIKNMSDKDLLQIKGVGMSRLHQIRNYFSKDSNQKESMLEMKVVKENLTKKGEIDTSMGKLIDSSKSHAVYLPKLKYHKSTQQQISVNNSLYENLLINSDYFIESSVITISQEEKKPRGLKHKLLGGTSVMKLKALSDFLPEYLPHIQFDEKNISYNKLNSNSCITNDTYRFQESSTLGAFLSSSKDLRVYLYNWNLEQLGIFDASRYAENYTHIRRIELTSDLSSFLITIVDKAYLLDSKMNIKYVWQVPFKEGFEKREVDASNNVDTRVLDCLKILELPDKPNKEEIKIAFRKQVFKWHPDRNPNIEAAERTRQLVL